MRPTACRRSTEVKAIAMRRGLRITVRTITLGLLMLATLVVYAAPLHAHVAPRGVPDAPRQAILAIAASVEADHDQATCRDHGLLATGACCGIAQCVTMHGGLPPGTVFALPSTEQAELPAALPMPEGIGTDPARRPPRPVV